MQNKQTKIYIAGHRGMVGGAILKELKNEGYTNIVYATRQELDLLNQNNVNDFFEKNKPQVVFCAAAIVGGIKASMENQTKFLLENLQIQNNIINASHKNGVERFVYFSSSCMYPTECPQPMKERHILTGELEPTCEGYAIAKIAGTKLVDYMHKEFGFNSVTIVPCNLYGPNDSFDPEHSHVLAALVRKFYEAKNNNKEEVSLWGTGSARRELLHVDDCAKMSIILAKNYSINSWVNVGCGQDFSIKELAYQIKALIGFEGNIVFDKERPDGALKKCTDISIIKDLDIQSKISLSDGILQMIDIYKNISVKNIDIVKKYK